MTFHPSRSLWRALLVFLLAACWPLVLFAQGHCGPGPRPGATLLIPYFEVDLDDPSGRTTLFSIANADSEPVVARVTVWTNMGITTLFFDVVLEADAVRTLNLRDLLEGDLPQSTGHSDFPQCIEPVVEDLPPDQVPPLQARYLGLPPYPNDGCYALPSGEPGLAVGYVTVDAMNDCHPIYTYPGENGYFRAGGTGLASNRNVLWGDVFYVDPGNDAAMGIAATALRADAERFGSSERSFYSGLDCCGKDNREPMPSTYRARFFAGGGFGGTSDLILWLDPEEVAINPLGGFTCGDPSLFVDLCQYLTFRVFDESGELVGEQTLRADPPLTRRVRIGSDELPVPADFGFLEIQHQRLGACIFIPTGFEPLQASAVSVLRAEGRFSAALESVALDSTCPEP